MDAQGKAEKRQKKLESFLEYMFNNLNDIHEGTDEEVEKELVEMGVDIEKAKESFNKTLSECRDKFGK
jgi:hypothetical protein